MLVTDLSRNVSHKESCLGIKFCSWMDRVNNTDEEHLFVGIADSDNALSVKLHVKA